MHEVAVGEPQSAFDPAEDVSVLLADAPATSLPPTPETFSISDEKSANWLIKKVVAARNYADRVKQWAEQERRRAEREEETLMFLFGRQLQAWTKGEVEKSKGKRKSICLPSGTVGFRRVNASLQVDDEQAVLVWARVNCPSAVVVVEKLSRSILSDHFKVTGEVPDHGAHVEGEREAFSIR